MNGAFFLIFACFWSAFILFLDCHAGQSLWKQFASRKYPFTTGQITHSQMTRRRGSKGRVIYGVDIFYRYAVKDHPYYGKRFRYNAQFSSGWTWAQQTVAEHPVGSQTQVFYNPQNPQDALLSPDVDGSDLMTVLFLMPFNIATLGFGTWGWSWLRERVFKPVAGGVRIIIEGPRTSIRLPEYAPMVWGMMAVGGLSLAAVLILGVASRSHPSLAVAAWGLAAVAAVGAGAYWWQWRKIHSGDDDLIIDDGAGTIELPETYGRKNRVTLTVSDIENLTVATITHRSSKGGVSYSYAPTLSLRGGGGAAGSQKLADWYDQMKAEAFADWLRQRLGLANVPAPRDD